MLRLLQLFLAEEEEAKLSRKNARGLRPTAISSSRPKGNREKTALDLGDSRG